MSTPLRWDNVGGPTLTAANLLNIAGTDNSSGGIEDISKGLTGFNDFLTNKKTNRIALAIQQMQDRDTLNADAAAAIAGGDPRFMDNKLLADVLAKREVSLQEKERVDLGMEVSELGMDSTRLDMRATQQDMGTQKLEDERRRFEAGTRQELHDLEVQRLRFGLAKDQNVVKEGDIKLNRFGERLDANQAKTEAQTRESNDRNNRANRTSEDFFIQRALKLDQDRQTAELYAKYPGTSKEAQLKRTAEAMRLGIPLNRKNAAELQVDISLGTEARRKEALRQLQRTEKYADKAFDTAMDISKEEAKARLNPDSVAPHVLPTRGMDVGEKHATDRIADINSPLWDWSTLDIYTRERMTDLKASVSDQISPAEFETYMDEVKGDWDSYTPEAEEALKKRVNEIARKRRKVGLKK